MTITKQTNIKKEAGFASNRTYNEIVAWLDSRWEQTRTKENLQIIKKLDQILGLPSKAVNTILVAGTNGKGLAIHFTTQLFQEEKISVGSFYSPHILSYNERIAINNESVPNKIFTEIANEVINAAETNNLKPQSIDVLTMMALLHFKNTNVDVAILEVSENTSWHPLTICSPKITAITRVSTDGSNVPNTEVENNIDETLNFVKEDTLVISADQSKLNLQYISDLVKERKGKWLMPIRKLANLPYPFEQLHGRSAALAERIAQTYVDNFVTQDATFISNSLLVKPKGQRGRPTTEAKRELELNPRKTVEQFWKEAGSFLTGRFQLLEKEKPTILLDNASNIDAFDNFLLGIRLLHYKHPLKGLALIVGCTQDSLETEEFLKSVRYFFKKTSGQLIVCPISKAVPGESYKPSWDVETVINDVKGFKIKAKLANNFEDAIEIAKKLVDDRHGLIAITGSHAIIKEYWENKGIKKL
ncbi:hypothetical protein HN446_04545 [bacterium]|jgi:dihydrofolate synthase / folylpolyglutamate synthase|nr:hypothetical protein [bacterium]